MSTTYLRRLFEYWPDEFDWRAMERKINGFTHHRRPALCTRRLVGVDVDGSPAHFICEPGKGPAPIPLLLVHGWPWTFWDWSKVIRPLTDPDAFGGPRKTALRRLRIQLVKEVSRYQ